MSHRQFGVAVIGSGRMGLRRAGLAAVHPAVNFIAVSDVDRSRARGLAEKVGAQFHSDDNLEAMSRPEVQAVIVSTSEHDHTRAVLQAIDLGKPVLVEKPIALNLEEADQMLAAAAHAGVELHVAYSRRFKGNRPVEVVARGQKAVYKAAGYDIDDVTWAILTFADGAVVSIGLDYALPANYPTFGPNARVEVLGTEGVFLIDDDNKDQIFYTERGITHSYVPGHTRQAAR